LLGAATGLGALVSWRLLFPSPPPLQAAIDRLNRRNELVGITHRDRGDSDVNDLLGRTGGAALGRLVRNLGLRLDSLEADLRLVGRSLEEHMAQKVLLALFGLALPVLLGVIWTATGVDVSLTIPFVGALALATFFFFAPDLTLRSEAAARRK